MRRIFPVLIFFGLLIGLSACKKELPNTEKDPDKPEVVYVKEDTIKDSVFYYTKLLSLWQDFMPPRNVNDITRDGTVRSYTKNYKTAENVLDWMLSLTPIDPNTRKPIDRYSFLDRAGVISGEIQGAVAKSFGMYIFYLDKELHVKMVDLNSPAYHAGIRRGDKILSINGNSNLGYDANKGENFKTINSYLLMNSMEIRFAKPTGAILEKQMANVAYDLDPVMDSRVLNVDAKKVGYLAFSSFVSLEDKGLPTRMFQTFERIFSSFETEGIQELIVDMRYNGGGAVLTAEYLADRIAPASADKSQMYYYEMNKVLTNDWEWTAEGDDFGPVYFAKKGSLNLSKVYFLVSKSTASASELLINALKPYMAVHMIGTYAGTPAAPLAENTYGKPVGFFGIQIVDKNIELYVSSFKTFNANKEGEYYNGMVPAYHVWEFSTFKDFGDPQETMTAAALSHIKNGKYAPLAERKAVASRFGSTQTPTANAAELSDNRNTNGMFKYPKNKSAK